MADAFQSNAFQTNAFQITVSATSTSTALWVVVTRQSETWTTVTA